MCRDRRRSEWARGALLGVAAALLATTASAEEGRIAYLARSGDFWQVWTVGVDGAGAREVTRSAYDKTRVSWFPGGKHVLVNGLDGSLAKVEVASGAESAIPSPLGGIFDAVLSPDGRTIAFSSSTSGSRDANDIWVVNANGTQRRRLTNMPHLQHWPAWSRDGRWVYFLSGDGGQQQDIWKVSLEGEEKEQVSVGGLYHFDVAASADGVIAFSNNRSGNYEIWIQEGRNPPEQVTEHPGVDGGPAWSPDGRDLVFQSGRGGVINLWRITRASGEPAIQLTRHEGGARGAAWWRP